MRDGQISREVLNLYALTAFLGWAHFFYAWDGQWRSSARMTLGRRVGYWLVIALVLAALVSIRSFLGVGVFSLLVWVYNIAHFIKAETFFAGAQRTKSYYSPAIAFAWFTLALFQVGPLASIPVVLAGSVVLAVTFLLMGDWKALATDDFKLPLLTLFLLGETLVWTAYGPYMTPAFRVGVYVFHIAAASFFHYLGSYFYANSASPGRRILSGAGIALVNLTFLLVGLAVSNIAALHPFSVVFAPEWFTLWVALHLAASDLMPWWKRRGQNGLNQVGP
jgi:hypothetical protein